MFEKKTIDALLIEANWEIHPTVNVKQDKVKPSEIIKMEMCHSMFWSCRFYAVMILDFTPSWW